MADISDIETVILLKRSYDTLIEKIAYLDEMNYGLRRGIIGEISLSVQGAYQGIRVDGILTTSAASGGFEGDIIEINGQPLSEIISALFDCPLDDRHSLGEMMDFGVVRLSIEKIPKSEIDNLFLFGEPIKEKEV